MDTRNNVSEASPGDKSYQVPEYSPHFHKEGSTRPLSIYGPSRAQREPDTFIPLVPISARYRPTFQEKEKGRARQTEIDEVRQLDTWKPATPLFLTLPLEDKLVANEDVGKKKSQPVGLMQRGAKDRNTSHAEEKERVGRERGKRPTSKRSVSRSKSKGKQVGRNRNRNRSNVQDGGLSVPRQSARPFRPRVSQTPQQNCVSQSSRPFRPSVSQTTQQNCVSRSSSTAQDSVSLSSTAALPHSTAKRKSVRFCLDNLLPPQRTGC